MEEGEKGAGGRKAEEEKKRAEEEKTAESRSNIADGCAPCGQDGGGEGSGNSTLGGIGAATAVGVRGCELGQATGQVEGYHAAR